MADVSTITKYIVYIKSNPLLEKTVYALIVILAFVIAERALRRYTDKLVRRNVITQSIASRVISVLDVLLYFLLILAVLYVITSIGEFLWITVGLVLIIIASMWPILENVQSYFALLTSKSVNLGKVITINGATGKVLEMTPIYTVIRTTRGDLIYIPNKKLLTEHHTVEHEYGMQSLHVVIKNLSDVAEIEFVEGKIKDVLSTKFRLGVRGIEPEVHLVRASRDQVEYLIRYAIIGAETRHTHATHLIKLLLDELKDFNIEITVK